MPPKRKAATNTASAAATTDFSKLKVADLKAECTKRGLDASGKKQDLVDRLEKDEAAGGKKVKAEEPLEESDVKPTMKEKLMALAQEEKKNRPKSQREVDKYCHLTNAEVYEDYDCMLNQTNVGQNNNKFYVIQLIKLSGCYYVWTRWGRVGESGANSLIGPNDVEVAKKGFEKKFKDKTKNDWKNRDNFQPAKGKYTLLEMDSTDETDAPPEKSNVILEGDVKKKVRPCKLDKPTQDLLSLMFSNDMFKEAMQKMNIDVKKMPLGKLSKMQVAKGFEVLEEMEEILEKKSKGSLEELTSRFYTVIPHNFGRQRPPVINTIEVLRSKMDMLTVLGDIEIAQGMKREDEGSQADMEEVDHPLDVDYGHLDTTLELVDKKSKEFEYINKYTEATKGVYYRPNLKILDVWRVDRHSEGERFSKHDDIAHRKLLWHGTNVAVIAAIMKGGLRIMPHSGGRVGRGLYFASENGKSSGYVGTTSDGIGIMFLNEVALGKEHQITKDDHTLKAAPKGYDSVLAKGRTEPDPSEDVKMEFDGKDVIIPQGKPVEQKAFQNSYFSESEYLVYKESQVRIRYLLKMKFY